MKRYCAVLSRHITLAILLGTLAACAEGPRSVEPAEVPAHAPREVAKPQPQVVEEAGLADHLAPAMSMLAQPLMESKSKSQRALSKGEIPPLYTQPVVERDRFAPIEVNTTQSVREQPVSTFSIDVDTAAYALVRRSLNQGRLPAGDAVRIEELINYFDFDYPGAGQGRHPFSITTEIGPSPWKRDAHLVHIGIKGRVPSEGQRPAANLVFLIDVSGSMGQADKLPLLKSAFKLLSRQLRADDRVSLVVYAGASGVVLEPTPGDQRATIAAALERLQAGGGTHGSAGIELAYAMAEQGRIAGGINRVILATDGDFNLGVVNHERLMDLIEQKRAGGIALTTLGFGQGNYNDHLMEQLADQGNGNYAYIDTINEAQKVLVDELGATMETIASDVKIQVEWNPAVVAEYRLIGYENRLLEREDFNNDKVDAGEIGAGHSVSALYEITLHGHGKPRLEALRYGSERPATAGRGDEVGFLRLRYKAPSETRSTLIEHALRKATIKKKLAECSDNFRFSAAVAGFGELLRGGRYTDDFSYDAARELASGARGKDRFGYRGEFLRLVNLAAGLDAR